MIVYRLRREGQGAIDRHQRILHPAAQHLCCGEQPKCDGILSVHVDDIEDDCGSLVVSTGAKQQFGGMEPVEAIGRCDCNRLQRQCDGLFGLFQGEQGCR